MTQQLSEEERIREARRIAQAKYRKKNRKKLLERQKKWREENPEAVKRHQRDYWLRKADEFKVD